MAHGSEPMAASMESRASLNVPKTAYSLGQEWDKILAGQSLPSPPAVPITFGDLSAVAELPFGRLIVGPPTGGWRRCSGVDSSSEAGLGDV